MKEIQLNGQNISVPTSWDEIKFADYEKWYTNTPKDKLDYIQYISDLCKVDANVLLEASESIFEEIEGIMSFTSEIDFKPTQTIIINNELYTTALSDELTLGEWVDIDTILNSESETSLSDILGIVCRPLGEKYEHEKAKVRAKLFRDQSCADIMPLISFFLHKKQKFNETLNHSSMVVAAANQYLQDTKTFQENGDGIKRLPIWQRIRYSSLTKSLEKELSKFSDFYSI